MGFLERVASMSLHSLSIHSCSTTLLGGSPIHVCLDLSNFTSALPKVLSHFHSITHLSLVMTRHADVYAISTPLLLSEIKSLPNLQSLSVKDGTQIMGLDELISESRSLRSLSLFNVSLSPGQHLASPRLRHLTMSSSDVSWPLPSLMASDFPSLQVFRVGAAVI